MSQRGTHCDACGHKITPAQAGVPSKCDGCGTSHYSNPIPVILVVQPVRLNKGGTGIVLARRCIAPAIGKLVLPGGYLEQYGDWRESGQKELFQETCIQVAPETLTQLWWKSPPEKHLILLFCVGQVIHERDLPEFCLLPNEEGTIETSERVLATSSEEIPWFTHREAFDAVISRFKTSDPAYRGCHT